MIGHGIKLAGRPYDAGDAENGEVYPAGASTEAMAQGDKEGQKEKWNIEDEFENGDAIAGI